MKRTLNDCRLSSILGIPAGMLCVLVSSYAAQAQTAPPAILEIDVENFVSYVEDTADVTKYATFPNATPAVPPKNFYAGVFIGDIVAVNGQPAKGTVTFDVRRVNLTATSNPGSALADTARSHIAITAFEVGTTDGRIVGSLMSVGLSGAGTPPPGSPPGQSQGNNAITGGTGAFLGARGTQGQIVTPQTIAARTASIQEDPANRRSIGGGTVRFVLLVIPMARPEILTGAAGPMITHADFSPVTPARPGKAGETLIVKATGLGPTVPAVSPGQPFPLDAPQAVNSPVGVSVNGKPAEVINAIGWPGQVDTYRVDFRLPDTASATAAIQLTAAWIPGAAVSIPVQ
jgi:uncharacterized protein (TIGR03437 family)